MSAPRCSWCDARLTFVDGSTGVPHRPGCPRAPHESEVRAVHVAVEPSTPSRPVPDDAGRPPSKDPCPVCKGRGSTRIRLHVPGVGREHQDIPCTSCEGRTDQKETRS